MKKTLAVLLLLSLVVVGCTKGALSRASGSVEIGNTTAHYHASSDRIFLIIWHKDFRSSVVGKSSTSSAEHTEIEGNYSSNDGRDFRWICETKDGRSGTIIIDEVEYDLAKGNLFLVSFEQAPTVSQLSCEVHLSERGGNRHVSIHAALKSLAESDERIEDFVGRAALTSPEAAED